MLVKVSSGCPPFIKKCYQNEFFHCEKIIIVMKKQKIPSWSQRLDKTPWRLSIIPFNFPASKKSRNIGKDSKFKMWALGIVTEAFIYEYLVDPPSSAILSASWLVSSFRVRKRISILRQLFSWAASLNACKFLRQREIEFASNKISLRQSLNYF